MYNQRAGRKGRMKKKKKRYLGGGLNAEALDH
jgi:hypothetical protein